MKILRIIFLFPLALIRFIAFLLVTSIMIIFALQKIRIKGFSREIQVKAMQNWGRWMLWIIGVKVTSNKKPEMNNFIVMPNHRSYIDLPLIVKFFQGTMVGKAEVAKWPLARSAAKITNPIFVKRNDMSSLVRTMNKIKESVNNNIPVILFPEGTTHKGPMTKPFKNGSFKIAADAEVPVLPVAIHFPDPDDSWIDDDTFIGHFFRQMCKPRIHVTIQFGKPISNTDYKILQKETKEQIEGMLKGIGE